MTLVGEMMFLISEKPASKSQRDVKQRGFTLIELLIVMVILGLLASLVAPQMFGRVGSSKVQVAQTQMDMLATAVDAYMLDVGRPPSTLIDLVKSDARNWRGPYLRDEIPKDPWGNDYLYRAEGGNFIYELQSLGADNKSGGDDENADLSRKG